MFYNLKTGSNYKLKFSCQHKHFTEKFRGEYLMKRHAAFIECEFVKLLFFIFCHLHSFAEIPFGISVLPLDKLVYNLCCNLRKICFAKFI